MIRKLSLCALLAIFAVSAIAIAVEPTPTPSPAPKPGVPTLKLTSPLEAAKLQEGTATTITWELSPVVTVDLLEIALTDPSSSSVTPNRKVLATLKENPGKWTWEKVGPVGEKLMLEVTATIGKNVAGDAHSIVIFPGTATTPAPTPAPKPEVLKVLRPNGGDAWVIGSAQEIAWEANYMSVTPVEYTFKVTLSRDGGATYKEVLGEDLPSKMRALTIKVGGTPSEKCLLKVEIMGPKHDALATDVSDAAFAIKLNVKADDSPKVVGE